MSAALEISRADDFEIALERAADVSAREKLLDAAMGPGRRRKTSEKLRAGRIPVLALVARDPSGVVIGAVRLWRVRAKGIEALLLGPLAVSAGMRNKGVGARLMERAIAIAIARGEKAIFLVGDPAYYQRFGFSAERTRNFAMPGPFEPHRFLVCELMTDALEGAGGVLRASGEKLIQSPGRKAQPLEVASVAPLTNTLTAPESEERAPLKIHFKGRIDEAAALWRRVVLPLGFFGSSRAAHGECRSELAKASGCAI